MSEAILSLESGLLRGLGKAERWEVRADALPTLASQFELLADVVDANWPSLSPAMKKWAKVFAYHAVRNRASLRVSWRLAWFLLTHRTAIEDVGRLLTAVTRLDDAISPQSNARMHRSAIESSAHSIRLRQKRR